MRNFIALLITFIPFLLFSLYFITVSEPKNGINWIHSGISGIILAVSYSFANYYRKKAKNKKD